MITNIEADTGYGDLYVEKFPEAVTQYARIFVTLEVAEGSAAPTGPALLSATIQ